MQRRSPGETAWPSTQVIVAARPYQLFETLVVPVTYFECPVLNSEMAIEWRCAIHAMSETSRESTMPLSRSEAAAGASSIDDESRRSEAVAAGTAVDDVVVSGVEIEVEIDEEESGAHEPSWYWRARFSTRLT